MQLFRPALEAELIDRPNRFIVRVRCDGRVLVAHCANPGSMVELLHPGRKVILERAAPEHRRKTRFTLAAVYYHDQVIPLVSTGANEIAAELAIPTLFPGATDVRREVTHGNSRFDFGFCSSGDRWLLEVKACTLVHAGLAMFPDAPTERGTRHLQELAALSGGIRGALLVVVAGRDAREFLPNIHTDPTFASALIQGSQTVSMNVVSTRTEPDGMTELCERSLPIRWDLLDPSLERDSGVYLILAEIKDSRRIYPGALGSVSLRKGVYVYTGSAKRGLSSRTARHLRKRKKMHWHVDWLTASADRVRSLPIRTSLPLECDLAHTVSELASEVVVGFGCSDCDCASHLSYFDHDPMSDPRFIDMLLTFRHSRAFGH